MARRWIPVAGGALAVGLALGGCASSTVSSSTTPATTAQAAASGAPPGAPGGASGSSGAKHAATAAYTLTSGSAALRARTFTASATDESGVLVKGTSAKLSLIRPTIRTSGNTKSSDESSFYGLNAGALATGGARLAISGGSVTTAGTGANGVFAYGIGSSVTLTGVRITATGAGGHGVMASGGGAMRVRGLTVATTGASSAAVATDRGGGTISVIGGTFHTTGFKSPGIYSTGKITVTGATMTATGAEAAVVEGANSIIVARSTLSAARAGGHGVMLYNSMSGDASAGTARYTMVGGSLSAAAGPAFYVTNTRAVITLSGRARVHAARGVLLRADNAGTGSGNTGDGVVTLRLANESLSGNLVTAGSGTIAATLSTHSTLTGTINTAALTLSKTSVWKVTANSRLTSLAGAQISGTRITNIIGNGHTVTYRASLAANATLGHKTYSLAGGGRLTPA